MHMFVCKLHAYSAHRHHKRVSDALGLELELVISHQVVLEEQPVLLLMDPLLQ